MTKILTDHLAFIYGSEQAPAILEDLMVLIRQARAKLPIDNLQKYTFSEQDTVLITYGDTIQQEGQIPLQTLHRFVKDHMADMISTVHILPFHPYSSDDGFSVIDYEQVDPKLGDWGDIRAIASDFGLMADFVCNHMSSQSDWFKKFLAGEADFDELFMTADPALDLSSVTRPRTSPLLTAYQRTNGEMVHVWTTFSADQVDFDFRSPQTLTKLMAVLLHYIEQGATVIRLDAIAYLWKEPGTTSIHLPQTHRVVQLMRSVLDEVAPHVMLITETNVPHAENISYFGDGHNEAQMVYNFTLPPLLLYTLMSGNAAQLRTWVNTLRPISNDVSYFNFTASHDGIGMRPLEGIVDSAEIRRLADFVVSKGGHVSYRKNPDGSQSPYELNITYVDAVTSPELPEDLQVKQFMVSQAIMLAMAGVPGIYIHSVLGSHNDNAAVERLGYNRAINRAKFRLSTVEAALNDSASFRAKVFNAYRHLLAIRRSSRLFHPLVPQVAVDVENDGVFALHRAENNTHQLLALHNVTTEIQTVELQRWIGNRKAVNLLNNAPLHETSLHLAPYEVVWLELGED